MKRRGVLGAIGAAAATIAGGLFFNPFHTHSFEPFKRQYRVGDTTQFKTPLRCSCGQHAIMVDEVGQDKLTRTYVVEVRGFSTYNQGMKGVDS